MTTKTKKRDSGTQLTGGLHEHIVALGNTGTAKTVDATLGSVFTCTLTGNCTFTLTGAVANKQTTITLWITRDATTTRTIAFAGGTIKTNSGVALATPAASASSLNCYVCISIDGGTTWTIDVVGLGYA